MRSGCGLNFRRMSGFPIPRQQFFDALGRVIGDAGEDIGEPGGRRHRSTYRFRCACRSQQPACRVRIRRSGDGCVRPAVRRRRFTDEEKRHFLELANRPGSSVSDVAQRYDLAISLLFRWRKELGDGPVPFAGFMPATIYYRTGGAYCRPPSFQSRFNPRSILRGLPVPTFAP